MAMLNENEKLNFNRLFHLLTFKANLLFECNLFLPN